MHLMRIVSPIFLHCANLCAYCAVRVCVIYMCSAGVRLCMLPACLAFAHIDSSSARYCCLIFLAFMPMVVQHHQGRGVHVSMAAVACATPCNGMVSFFQLLFVLLHYSKLRRKS